VKEKERERERQTGRERREVVKKTERNLRK
jgi:hypothetical protein